MEKKQILAGVALMVVLSSLNPVYAEEADVSTKQTESYTITAIGGGDKKIGDPSPNKTGSIGTRAIKYYSVGRGEAVYDLTGESTKTYSDGLLKTTTTLDANYKSAYTNYDYFYLDGKTQAFWSGNTPYDADRISVTPSHSFTSSGQVYSVSVPAGVSYSTTSNSITYTWPTESADNVYSLEYDWDRIGAECRWTSVFTKATATDTSNFKFGTKITSVTNTINIDVD